MEFIIGPNETEFKAHRVLLAAISPVWEAMLYGHMRESEYNAQVIIPDIHPNAFQSVLNFAYNNDPKLTPDNVLLVGHICDKYQINSLSSLCHLYMKQCLNITNFCQYLNSAVRLNFVGMIEKCNEWLQENIVDTINIITVDGI